MSVQSLSSMVQYPTDSVVSLRGVTKVYRTGPPWRRRETVALRDVNLEVGQGQAVALVGQNGAGKSTILRLVTGLLTPDAGMVSVSGARPDRDATVRSQLGFSSGEERSLFQRLSGLENLQFHGALHGLSRAQTHDRIATLEEEIELGDLLQKRVDSCSAGMKARLMLARALLHEPSVVVLDEPTRSLDQPRIDELLGALGRWLERGRAILIATHSHSVVSILGARPARLKGGVMEDLP